jgi:hypothetical protein
MRAADRKLDFDTLMRLARQSAGVGRDCGCMIATYHGWTRIPADFPQAQMRTIGTLLDDPHTEPTYAEYHPDGTGYWSPDAPIAIRFYPYNRCTVLQCEVCGRACLSYVEGGGYYVEPRIRTLDPALVVDVPPAD